MLIESEIGRKFLLSQIFSMRFFRNEMVKTHLHRPCTNFALSDPHILLFILIALHIDQRYNILFATCLRFPVLREFNMIQPIAFIRLTDLLKYTFFYKQLSFSSEPGVANEIFENQPKSCLMVA